MTADAIDYVGGVKQPEPRRGWDSALAASGQGITVWKVMFPEPSRYEGS